MNWLKRWFRPTPTNHARELAKHGAQQRKATQREKMVATTQALCVGAGIPIPECFR